MAAGWPKLKPKSASMKQTHTSPSSTKSGLLVIGLAGAALGVGLALLLSRKRSEGEESNVLSDLLKKCEQALATAEIDLLATG